MNYVHIHIYTHRLKHGKSCIKMLIVVKETTGNIFYDFCLFENILKLKLYIYV